MITEQTVYDKIKNIASRPEMWALTREAYVAQLSVLAELLGCHLHYDDLFESVNGTYQGLTYFVTPEWAARMSAHVFELLKSSPRAHLFNVQEQPW